MEIEKRNEAMAKPISSGNKGFLLLQKMMAKSQQNEEKTNGNDSQNSATSESQNDKKTDLKTLMSERQPILIDFKADRKGIGHRKTAQEVLKRKQTTNEQSAMTEEEYRQSKRLKSDLFYARKDFYSCQRSCVNLDQQMEITTPKEEWFWPPEHRDNKEDDNEDNEEEDNEDEDKEEDINAEKESKEEEENIVEKLEKLVDYLRQEYSYCNWCGIRYESSEDLTENCPGNRREDHQD